MQHFDVIVAGCGALGSAALHHLARQGYSAIALDRFPPGHDRGSSHGETRVIRQAYFEHPDYVPMLMRAYELWEALAAESGEALYHETGVLQIGPENGTVIPGVLRSATEHGLPITRLSASELAQAHPGFELPEGFQALREDRGGYLRVEDCIRAHVRLAKQAGASTVIGESIIGWSDTPQGVSVKTDRNHYSAGALIVTAGAWAGQLLPTLTDKLTVQRKHLHWFANNDARYREDHGAPVFFYEIGNRCFYGFPQINQQGVKVSEHSDGETIDDPMQLERTEDEADLNRIRAFLRHLPGVSHQHRRHEVCMYTMSPDGNFVVDYWPESSNIVYAAGMSGHGFKFASVLGQDLARMVTHGPTPELEFLRAARLA